jgi:hypothetical protein
MKEVTTLNYEQTLLHAHGGQMTVATLLERLAKVDPTMPVYVSVDGFNFAEVDDNGLMVLDDTIVIGPHHEVQRAVA